MLRTLGYGITLNLHPLSRNDTPYRMKHTAEEDDVGFLNPDRVKKTAEKQESGELTCNIDDPEDCESCSG